ncbi:MULTISPECIES: hypothetical protein [unclassified Gordonia (in: high G+C Gram-positive bacteria)]|uniref:hypothetical protein n=1 Tax=unclassified Gordonia (in: high G+C Gram-positive bacteria) TaxID=2657482 RepID=UPI001FFF2168|nr:MULTISPECIES: hypothetical protein [unclassified Gordonia (in: high G+C Gram-positive bacteria)]UQE73228.1 hypothetical protein MYK68_10575 [Gordonia sp. PP30]
MTVAGEALLADALATGEALLTRRAGSSVTLTDPEDLGGTGRSTVVRSRLGDNPLATGRTVVIKVLDDGAPIAPFLREVAAYRYATALPTRSRPGPQLLASDTDARMLVLTDLGHGRSMIEVLGEDADTAARGLSAWGQALGRMHAATVGGEDDFRALLRRTVAGSAERGADEVAAQARDCREGAPALVQRLGIPLSDRLAADLREGCRLFTGGDLRAFSPSDVGPENILINEDGVQFMDYEFGAFRDGTLDVAYALATFPARLSEVALGRRADLEKRLVDAWRSEVEALWPVAHRDGEFTRRLLVARTLWVWLSTHWMVGGGRRGHDWALHTTDARVVLTRWADLGDAARRAGDTELAGAADEMERALRLFWFE